MARPFSPRSRATCELARRNVSVELDDELGPFETARLRAHLSVCEDCRSFRHELQSLTLHLRRDEPQPVTLLERARPRKLNSRAAGTLVAAACAVAITFTALTARSNPEVSIAESLAAQGTPVPILFTRAYSNTVELEASTSAPVRPDRSGLLRRNR